MAVGDRITFKVPRRQLAVIVMIMVGFWLAVIASLFWRSPGLQASIVLLVLAPRVIGLLALATVAYFIRVPVVVEADGVRFAWIFRLKWAEVKDARIRRVLWTQVLEISRHRGFTWRPHLRMYSGLPEFLARHAPEGNPLRQFSADASAQDGTEARLHHERDSRGSVGD